MTIIRNFLLRFVYAFRDIGIAIFNFFKKIVFGIIKIAKRFIDGSIWTKLSHIFMGIGNIARKQYIKGFIFLAVEALFITFMIASPKVNGVSLGAKALPNFFSLGEEKGMPITTQMDVLDNLVGLDFYATDATTDSDLDLTDDNELGKVALIIRSINLSNAVDELDNSNFVIEDNSSEYNDKYSTSVYSKIIKDNRFNSDDIYGYNKVLKNQDIVLPSSSPSVIIIKSDTELTDFVNAFTITLAEGQENNIPTINLYKYSKDITANTYLLLVVTSGRKNTTITFTDKIGEANVYNFGVNTNYVNSNVDNSFLMMLFGIVTFAVIGVFFAIWLLAIDSSYKTDLDLKEGKTPTTFKEDAKTLIDGRFHITLLAPAIILILVFTIIPTILMILIAFTNMDSNAMISGQRVVRWAGVENFVALFSGDVSNRISKEVGANFLGVLSWTFEWAIIATFSCYFGGIFLALLLNRKDIKIKKFWRTIFILTIAIPQFITLLIFRNLLKESGPINSALLSLGIIKNPIDFLQTSGGFDGSLSRVWLARGTVLLINLYIGVPYTMLMTSGILMNIPADLYEAATIDGANKWQMFRKITLPYVIFVTTPYLISSFIGNITSFNTIFLTTGGGPTIVGSGSIAGKTDLLVTWLYKMTIDNYIYNAGSIIGILTFLITAFITLICYRNSKSYKEEDTFQ